MIQLKSTTDISSKLIWEIIWSKWVFISSFSSSSCIGWFTPLLRDINLWPPLWCSMVMYSVTCSKSDITSCLLVGWFIVCWRMTRPCLEFLLRKLNWQMTLMNCKMLCVWHFDELVHSFFLKTFTSHIFENKFFFVCAVLAYLPFIF